MDPFFSGFPSPFGRDPFLFGVTPRHHGVRHGNPMAMNDPFGGMAIMPFGGMSTFSSMFMNMEQMMQQAANDPNAHTFSSSSVMHYSSSTGDGGQPRVYHATSSTRQAPGGIKETHKSVQDSASGERKFAIGHHIGDRSHTIEKKHNTKTNEREESQHFVNLDETDAGRFDQEWTQKTHALNTRYSLGAGRHVQRETLANSRGLGAPPTFESRNPTYTLSDDPPVANYKMKRKHRPSSLIHDDDMLPVAGAGLGGSSVLKQRKAGERHSEHSMYRMAENGFKPRDLYDPSTYRPGQSSSSAHKYDDRPSRPGDVHHSSKYRAEKYDDSATHQQRHRGDDYKLSSFESQPHRFSHDGGVPHVGGTTKKKGKKEKLVHS